MVYDENKKIIRVYVGEWVYVEKMYTSVYVEKVASIPVGSILLYAMVQHMLKKVYTNVYVVYICLQGWEWAMLENELC
jgi:hypothetical protein